MIGLLLVLMGCSLWISAAIYFGLTDVADAIRTRYITAIADSFDKRRPNK